MESAMACEKILSVSSLVYWFISVDLYRSNLNFVLQEFFLNVKNVTRKCNVDKLAVGYSKWLPCEIELDRKFNLCKSNVHTALCGKLLPTVKKHVILMDKLFLRQCRHQDNIRGNQGMHIRL